MSDALNRLSERLPEVAELLQWWNSNYRENADPIAALEACAERLEQAEAEVERLRDARFILDNYPHQFLDRFEEMQRRAQQAEADLAAPKAQRDALIADWNKEHPRRLDAEAEVKRLYGLLEHAVPEAKFSQMSIAYVAECARLKSRAEQAEANLLDASAKLSHVTEEADTYKEACQQAEAEAAKWHAYVERGCAKVIEELEAELAALKEPPTDGDAETWHTACKVARDELAALKARRCETCRYSGWDVLRQRSRCIIEETASLDDFACNLWAAREEEP
jgi:chromosome segregation ATPase